MTFGESNRYTAWGEAVSRQRGVNSASDTAFSLCKCASAAARRRVSCWRVRPIPKFRHLPAT